MIERLSFCVTSQIKDFHLNILKRSKLYQIFFPVGSKDDGWHKSDRHTAAAGGGQDNCSAG